MPTSSRRGTPSALGATRNMFRPWRLSALISWRPAVGLRHSVIVAGLLKCLILCVWFFATAAAGATMVSRGAQTGGGLSGSVGLNVNVFDKAFYSFAETLEILLSDEKVTPFPLKKYFVMFNTAWVTTSTAPIAAAGVLGQPLGRAMVATASSHALFAVSKFTLAYGAMNAGSDVTRVPVASTSGRSKLRAPSPKPWTVRSRTLLPLRRARPPGPGLLPTGEAAGAETDSRMTIQIRRSAKTVPRIWLMVVTALGGPGVGTVAALATHRLGLITIPAVWSSVSRGSALGTLISASLCHGGVGTCLAARWAVFQGIFGVFIAFLLSLEVLLAVSIFNTVAGARRRSLENDAGEGTARGGSDTPKIRDGGEEREKDKNNENKS